MTKSRTTRLLLVLSALAAVGAWIRLSGPDDPSEGGTPRLAGAQDDEPEPLIPEGALVFTTDKDRVLIELSNPDIHGSATYSILHKEVEVTWVYTVGGLTDGALLLDPTKAKHTQSFSVAFVPTEVSCIDTDTLAVAGVTETGHTIVERWTLQVPPTPAVTYDQTGNQLVPNLTMRESRENIARFSNGEMGPIGVVFRNWAAADRPLLFFPDSATLSELDTATRVATPIVSGTNPNEGLYVPELNDASLSAVGSGVLDDDPVDRALYWFYTPGPEGDVILLVDDAVDGSIDAPVIVQTEDWGSSPYSDPDRYLAER